MSRRVPTSLISLAAGLSSLAGCTYGVRGGPTAVFGTAGLSSVGGGLTAAAGFADDEGALRGFHATANLHNVGYDLVGDGPSALGGVGAEYFHQSQGEAHRLGFRVGTDVAFGVTPKLDYWVVAPSVGVRHAFIDDRAFPYVDLGGLVGVGFGLEESTPTGLVGMVGITLGWMKVHSFRL